MMRGEILVSSECSLLQTRREALTRMNVKRRVMAVIEDASGASSGRGHGAQINSMS